MTHTSNRLASPRFALLAAMPAILLTGSFLALACPDGRLWSMPAASGCGDFRSLKTSPLRLVCQVDNGHEGFSQRIDSPPASPPGQLTPREPAPGKPPAKEATPEAAPQDSAAPPATQAPAQRDEVFKKLVTNVKLVGNFTIDGGDLGNLQREEYVISGAMKLGHGDLWALTSRIKYGDVDLTVPVPVQVKWAGDTPVITVESVKIPGLGTFSARVLLDKARYAGTWSHDEKGGNLFGVIERVSAEGE